MEQASAEYEPRHRAGPPCTPYGDAVIARLAEQSPTAVVAERLRDSYRRMGSAFAAYLVLDDVDPYACTAEEDFENAYVATFDDQRSLTENIVDVLGWQQELDRRLHPDPLLRSVVAFDHVRIWDLAIEHFDILESKEGLHVFER